MGRCNTSLIVNNDECRLGDGTLGQSAGSSCLPVVGSYVMFDIVAPLNAPQIPAPKPPPAAKPPKLDWLEQRMVALIHESEPVKYWQVLNVVAEELSPRNRAEGRETRMKLLPKMQRLIDLGMVFRGWKNSVATSKPAPKPAGMPRRRRKRTVMKAIFTKAVNEVKPSSLPEPECRALKAQAEVHVESHGSQQPPPEVEKTKTATPEIVTNSARALATLPRRTKRWSGWIGPKRSYRGMQVRLASGEQVFVFGCLRGRTVWSTLPDVLNFSVAGVGVDWGVLPASSVSIVKNEHAVVLGKRKAGAKEKFSPRKQEAARVNGRQPAKAGRVRGRPPKLPDLAAG